MLVDEQQPCFNSKLKDKIEVSSTCSAAAVSAVALLVGMALFVRRRRRMQQQQLPSSVVGTDKGGTESPPGTNRDSMQDDKLAKR